MKNVSLNAILRFFLGIIGLGCLFIGHYLFGIRIFLKLYSFIIIFISTIEGIGNIPFSLRNKNWFWENHFAFRQENNKFFYIDLAIKLTGIFYLLNLSMNYGTADSSIRIFIYLTTCSFVFFSNSLQFFLTSMYFYNDWGNVSKKNDIRNHLNDITTERYEKIFFDTFSYEKDSLFRIFCILIFLFFIFFYDSFTPKLSDFLFFIFITLVSVISIIYNVFLCYRVYLWRIIAYTAIFSKINNVTNFLPKNKSISKFYFYSSLLFMCFTWCFYCALLIVLEI